MQAQKVKDSAIDLRPTAVITISTWLRGTDGARCAQIFSDLSTAYDIRLAAAEYILGVSRAVI
jgi:hypothetical protein